MLDGGGGNGPCLFCEGAAVTPAMGRQPRPQPHGHLSFLTLSFFLFFPLVCCCRSAGWTSKPDKPIAAHCVPGPPPDYSTTAVCAHGGDNLSSSHGNTSPCRPVLGRGTGRCWIPCSCCSLTFAGQHRKYPPQGQKGEGSRQNAVKLVRVS